MCSVSNVASDKASTQYKLAAVVVMMVAAAVVRGLSFQDKACPIMRLPTPGLLCKAGGLATGHNAAIPLSVAAPVQPLTSLLAPYG